MTVFIAYFAARKFEVITSRKADVFKHDKVWYSGVCYVKELLSNFRTLHFM